MASMRRRARACAGERPPSGIVVFVGAFISTSEVRELENLVALFAAVFQTSMPLVDECVSILRRQASFSVHPLGVEEVDQRLDE
jgi:hypothetical protein